MKEITFEELEVPQDLGIVEFQPVEESVKKFAYAVEDETGWFLGDPKEGWVHPVFLSNYLWWPEGFYLKEPCAVGHFTMFEEKYGHLIRYPFLHAKTFADFINPFRIDKKLQAEVRLVENFHTHDEIAKEDGLGEAVPQGLMSYGYLSEMCTLFFGNRWANGGTLNVNFVGMLRKNDLLTVRGKVKEKAPEGSKVRLVLEVSVENDRGELVAVGTASGLVD